MTTHPTRRAPPAVGGLRELAERCEQGGRRVEQLPGGAGRARGESQDCDPGGCPPCFTGSAGPLTAGRDRCRPWPSDSRQRSPQEWPLKQCPSPNGRRRSSIVTAVPEKPRMGRLLAALVTSVA